MTKTPTKQLELFDNKLPEKADNFYFDLECKVSDLKYYGYLVEISIGKTIILDRMLKAALELGQIMKQIVPYASTHKTKTNKQIDKWCYYDPIPAPLDHRDVEDLLRILNRYKLSARAVVMRNKDIIAEIGIGVEMHLDEHFRFVDQAIAALKKLDGF